MLMLPLVKDLFCQALKSFRYHQNALKLIFFRSNSKPSKIKGGSDQVVITLNQGGITWILQLTAKRGRSLLKRHKHKYNCVTESDCWEGTLERKSQSNISIQKVIQEYFPPCKMQFVPWCCQGIAKNKTGIAVSWIQQKFFLKITFMSSGTVNISLGSPKKEGDRCRTVCSLLPLVWLILKWQFCKKQPSSTETAKKPPCTFFACCRFWNKGVLLPQFLTPDTSWSSKAVV